MPTDDQPQHEDQQQTRPGTRNRTLSIRTPDGTADAFAVFPDGGGPHPGVLMYPDGFGIRPVLCELAGELAAHGYCVLVPNVFYRDRPTPVMDLPDYIDAAERPRVMAQLMPLIEAHTAGRTLADAAVYLRVLADLPEAAPGPVAVTGYCFGGLLAVRTAAAHPDRVAAVAAFHAPVAAAGPDTLARLTGHAHFGHAASDLTPADLTALNATLAEVTALTCTSEIYPDTAHGFTMRDTDAYDAAGLARHWDRLLPLLARAL
ncbi:dienelactone hydrolase family protein [Streptomyces sp. SID5785]|uniref:dienelactone hydrolase family protein n=1 Tax=Streptomyces sp. SID5785 TaxID=2690309 RepID=UPI001360B8C3|nr:alpha/beta fold hydrolase [Streptomyces sp. SID5785]MZD06435.1 dienelactone hydrolase family protein [Streptomyces sp. SID5785]